MDRWEAEASRLEDERNDALAELDRLRARVAELEAELEAMKQRARHVGRAEFGDQANAARYILDGK